MAKLEAAQANNQEIEMLVSMKSGKREEVFTWPNVESVPENERARFVCIVPDRTFRQNVQSKEVEWIADDKTGTTKLIRTPKIDELIEKSIIRIENTFDADTKEAIPTDLARRKWSWFFQENMGLDAEHYGCLETEFEDWFRKKILRQVTPEDAKKNSTPTATASTDSGEPNSEQPSGKTMPDSGANH